MNGASGTHFTLPTTLSAFAPQLIWYPDRASAAPATRKTRTTARREKGIIWNGSPPPMLHAGTKEI
uniref:Uncharacterized protein n=1 Tax=Arundo donax TaxID=35708 RepID=A0A0A9CY42_ARUDO